MVKRNKYVFDKPVGPTVRFPNGVKAADLLNCTIQTLRFEKDHSIIIYI